MDIMIVEIFLKAFVLCGLLYLVARNEADFDFAKVAMVTAGISIGTFFIDLLLQPHIGVLTFIPSIAFVMFMIMKFCWAPFWKALLVTFLYLVFNIALAIGVLLLINKVNDSSGETVMSKHDKDLMEARQMVHEMYNMPPPPPLPAPEASAKPPSQAEEFLKMFKEFFSKPKSCQTEPVVAAPTPITVIPAATTAAPVALAVSPRPATAAPPVSVVLPETPEVEPAPAPAPEPVPAVAPPSPAPASGGGFKAFLHNMSGRAAVTEATADAPGWDTARAKIGVSAVMTGKNGNRVAVVNGEMIEEGTYFSLEHERLIYRWLLKEVKRSKVVWEPAPAEPAVAK